MPDAVPLESVTAADFAPHTGSLFTLALPGDEPLALTLREVTPLGRDAPKEGGGGPKEGGGGPKEGGGGPKEGGGGPKEGGGGPPRRPFSLLFTGPVVPPLLQQIYPLRHEVLGALDLFLVPVGETPEQREYQAVFG